MFKLMMVCLGLVALQEWTLLPEATRLQRDHVEALLIALLLQPWVVKQLE